MPRRTSVATQRTGWARSAGLRKRGCGSTACFCWCSEAFPGRCTSNECCRPRRRPEPRASHSWLESAVWSWPFLLRSLERSLVTPVSLLSSWKLLEHTKSGKALDGHSLWIFLRLATDRLFSLE
ncbi:hypothetical protein OESDEN_22467 [Oesophagostomum dentatum]|uniref:Uncharacterized protein n=1 Tax=Oesophagostomum dentatum TaxID=61180 RepID=A0A0B1RXW3_OESDE|nr:hypothetical protein OESDEN_22467 [Oesophagostomum dentatum]